MKKGLFIQQKGAFSATPIKDKNKRNKIFIKGDWFSICLQDIEIQSFAKPLNTRKISANSLRRKIREL